VAVRIRWRCEHQRSRAFDCFSALPRLHEHEDQIVRGFPEIRPLGKRPAVGLDRGIKRTNTLEGLAESILHVRIPRREPGCLPQKRKRARVVALLFELDRSPIHISRACVGDLSKRNRRRRADQRQPCRRNARSERHERPILQGQ
jgi:hypothetical protein